jgi:GT2 family glycosyltransferase
MVLLPDYIEEFMKANHNNPYAVLVSNIETPTDNYSLWNNLHDLRFEQQQKQAETNPYDLPYTCLFTGSLLVPRLLFEKIGGFDQVSFSYYGGEDFDFGIRFRDAGVKIAYANRAIAVHKQKSISFARYLDKTVWEAKSLARLLAKHKGVLAKESHKWEYLGKMPGVDVRLSQPVKQVVKNIIALPVISIMIVLLAGLLWALGLKHMALKVGGFGIKYYGLGYFDKELRTQLIRSKRTA